MRVSVQIVLFLIFFNAGAQMIISAGVAADLGIDPHVSESDELDQAEQEANNFDTGSGFGDTLFGMYNALADTVTTILNAIFPGLAMLKAAGVPGFFADFIFAGASLYSALDLIGFLRSGGLP